MPVPTSRAGWLWEESGDAVKSDTFKQIYYKNALTNLETLYGPKHAYVKSVKKKLAGEKDEKKPETGKTDLTENKEKQTKNTKKDQTVEITLAPVKPEQVD